MNKSEFINKLKNNLSGLPHEDIEKFGEYYSEMIDDRTEEGMSEEQAVNALGDVASIAQKIKNEYVEQQYNDTYSQESKPKQENNNYHSGKQSDRKKYLPLIVLAFFGIPILLPILAFIFVIIITVGLTILIVPFITGICFAALGLAGIAAFIMYTVSGSFAYGTILLGLSLILLGLSMLVAIVIKKLAVLIFKLICLTFKKFKNIKKKGSR